MCSSMSGNFFTCAGGKEVVTLDDGLDPAIKQYAGAVCQE